MTESGVREFPCPQCGKAVAWNSEARFKPFCSERCRLIDLGAWLDERHRIAGESVEPDGLPEQDVQGIADQGEDDL